MVMLLTGSFHLKILELGQLTKDQIFSCDFTFEKCGSCGVAVLFLGETVEVVSSQQDRDLAGVGQLAVSCARYPLVRH